MNQKRYTYAMNVELTLGEPSSFEREVDLVKMFDEIDSLQPQRLTTNVPGPGIVMLDRVRLGESEVLLNGEQLDAWAWNPNAVGQHQCGMTLKEGAKAILKGHYTGIVPPVGVDCSFSARPGQKFVFMLCMTGPCDAEG